MKKGVIRTRLLTAALALCMTVSAAPAGAWASTAVDDSYCAGSYTGTGTGYDNGKVEVTVTLAESEGHMVISDIQADGSSQTPAFWQDALAVVDSIKENNGTTGVSAVSGATLSSEAILDAVDQALAKSLQAAKDKDDRTVFSAGSGTEKDPYIINTASQLTNFAESVDEGTAYTGQYIELGADIDLSGIENWNPAGDEGKAAAGGKIFNGSFDGNGHTISGMTISGNYTAETNSGLFSVLDTQAVISNVRVEDADIEVTGTDQTRAGIIAGDTVSGSSQAALVENCRVSGSVSCSSDNAVMIWAAGVLGRAQKAVHIINCSSEAEIYAASLMVKPWRKPEASAPLITEDLLPIPAPSGTFTAAAAVKTEKRAWPVSAALSA